MTATLATPRPSPAPPLPAPSRPRLRRLRYEPDPGAAVTAAPAPRTVAPGPPGVAEPDREAVRRILTGCLRVAMEVLDGRRPLAQLGPHFDEGPLRYWRAAAHQRRTGVPARVRRMLLCLPHPDAAEVSAVCDIDGSVRALAARFDRAGTGWRCTALRLM